MRISFCLRHTPCVDFILSIIFLGADSVVKSPIYFFFKNTHFEWSFLMRTDDSLVGRSCQPAEQSTVHVILFFFCCSLPFRIGRTDLLGEKRGERAMTESRSDRPRTKFFREGGAESCEKWGWCIFPPFYTKLSMKLGSSSAILDHHHCLIIHSLLQLLQHCRSIHPSLSRAFCHAKYRIVSYPWSFVVVVVVIQC